MSLNEQLTVRIELHLTPRIHSLHPSGSDNTKNNIFQSSSTSRDASTLATTENSINSLIQTPSQYAIFQKNKGLFYHF